MTPFQDFLISISMNMNSHVCTINHDMYALFIALFDVSAIFWIDLYSLVSKQIPRKCMFLSFLSFNHLQTLLKILSQTEDHKKLSIVHLYH